MKQPSTKNIIITFFVTAFLCLGFFVIATFRNMKQTQEHSGKANTSLQFLLLTEKIMDHLKELDSAESGYILLPKEKFIEAFSKAATNLQYAAGELNKMKVQNPERNPEIEALGYLVAEKIKTSQQVFSIFENADEASVAGIKNKEKSKQVSENIITTIMQIEDTDLTVLNKSNPYLENIAQKTTYRFFLLAFIFFIILLIFLFIISSDFKRREKASAQLSYQASLIDTIPDAIFTTDKKFIIKTWNKYAEGLYGFSASEATGNPLNTLFTVHTNNEKSESSLIELNTGGYYKDEYLITKKNNETIFVLASINTIRDKDGEITGYVAVHRDITERKKLEDRQKLFNLELEKQVKIKTAETINTLERITDGFLALDGNLTYTFVNKKAGEILGFLPENMIGKNIFTDFAEAGSTAFNNACLQCFKNQQYTFLENYYAPLNIWLDNDIYPSADGLSIFFKDTTFKKEAVIALQESEERYRHLIEYIHAGVVVHRPDSSILLCNQEASRLLGLSIEQMQGKKAIDTEWCFLSSEGKKIEVEEYPVMQVIKTGKPINNIIGGIDGPLNKKRIWVLINAFPEFDIAMQLKQIVVTFVDITDRKKAEEELRRSEDNLNIAQNIAKTGSWELNLLTYDLKWSKELFRIFEIKNNIASVDLYDAYRKKFHPDDLIKLDEAIENAIEKKKGFTYQHRIITNNGAVKHILGIGEIILDTNDEVVGLKGTGQDITELIKAEEKLQNSYKQIKQLVTHLQDIREQERTSIAREIHDELGQQLTGLKMYISWLSKKITTQDAGIKEKFSATIELIEDTIKSVRKISMDLRPSMLDDLGLLAALEWQSNEFEKRSGVATKFINLTGNREIPTRLKTGLFRIFQESLTNVARHADAKKIMSSLKFEGNKLILTITDDGKGFTVKNIESKKTLGLFGMKERTIEMGGNYEIKSEPGQGTTVSIMVPLKN